MRVRRFTQRLTAGITGGLLALAVAAGAVQSIAPAAAPERIELLRWSGPGPVVTLDATTAGDAASAIGISLTSGQLFRFDADRVPQLDLAESAELSEDGLAVTVTLRPVEYSDGTPVTADDIAFAVERNRDSAAGAFVRTVESVEVVDDRTAVVHLLAPDPDLFSSMSERAWQLHPRALVEADPDYFSHPVSAGPYVPEGWAPGDQVIRLVENPTYHAGPMMVAAIEIAAIPDVSSRVLQLTTGDLDFAWDLPVATLGSYPDDVTVEVAPVGGMNYVAVNTSLGGPFAEPLVRQAISLAIDRVAVSELAFAGAQVPATSLLYNCGLLCEPNLLPGGGAQDLDAARALLSEAGYPDGFEATMLVSSGRGGWPDAAVIVAENLAEIGIDVEITPVDEGSHYSTIIDQNYELAFTGGAATPQVTLSQVMTPDGAWATWTGYTPPEEAVALVNEAGQELDEEVRRGLFTEIQRMAIESSHVIPVVERVQLTGSRLPEGLLTIVANHQLVNVQTVAEAEAGLPAGSGLG